MWLDVLALLILGLFAGMGALRGALASGLALLGLGVAYGAAVVAAPLLGPDVAAYLDIPGVAGMAFAGMGAFLAGLGGMGLVTRLLRRRDRRRGPETRGSRDRFLGGVFGGLRGALLVLLISYLALWVDALRATGTAPNLPALGRSAAAAVTGDLVEAGVEAALAERGASGRLVARMAARPGATLSELQALVDRPELSRLRSDAAFWTYVEAGAADAAMNRASFIAIAGDDDLRARFAELGLVPPEAAADRRLFRAAAGDALREVGPRIRSLKNDPELQELVEDPEVQAMLQSGDTLALVTHPRFRRIVARALEDPDAS